MVSEYMNILDVVAILGCVQLKELALGVRWQSGADEIFDATKEMFSRSNVLVHAGRFTAVEKAGGELW